MSSLQVMNSPSETERQAPNNGQRHERPARKAGWLVGAFILVLLLAGVVTIISKLSDKKALAGRLRFILPRRLGEVALFDDIPEGDVIAILEEVMHKPV